MAIKKILSYPEAEHILKTRSELMDLNDPCFDQLIQDLKDTLLATPNGIGLAAPQIGYLKRVFVLRKTYVLNDFDKNSIFIRMPADIITFINPKIITTKGVIYEEEGCLSVPGQYVQVERAKTIKVRAFSEQKVQFYERLKGLACRAVQQEIDHLNGVLILDHVKS